MATAARRGALLRWIGPVAGVLLLAALFIQLGPGRILSLISAIGGNVVIIVALFGSHECVRAVAVGRCLLPDQRLPFRLLLRIRVAGEAVRVLTHTGPFLSEPARAWMLARQGIHAPAAYAAAIAEFIANSAMSSLVTLVVLSAVLWSGTLNAQLTVLSRGLAAISLAYVAVVAVALACRIYVIGAVLRGVAALPRVGHRLRTDTTKVREMEDAIMHVLRDRPITLGTVLVLECLAQLILVLEVYWALRSMGVPVPIGTALLVEALTKTANLIQFMGATEGGYALVFNWLGMTAAVGFTLSLVKRVRSLAVAAIGLGLLTQWDRQASSGARPRTPWL